MSAMTFKPHELAWCFFEMWRRLGFNARFIFIKFDPTKDVAGTWIGRDAEHAYFLVEFPSPAADAEDEHSRFLAFYGTEKTKTASSSHVWTEFLKCEAPFAINGLINGAVVHGGKHGRVDMSGRKISVNLNGDVIPEVC